MRTNLNKTVLVCTNYRANPNNPSCGARGSNDLIAILRDKNLGITIKESPCMGLCDVGPNVRLFPNGLCIQAVSTTDLNQLTAAIKSFTKC